MPTPSPEASSDATFHQEVDRLHRLTVYGRWLVVGLLWLTLGAWSLWRLQRTISLALENFTWAALRYGLVFDRGAAVSLALCIGATVAVLVWQTRSLLWGLSPRDRQRLEQQVSRIRQQGNSHPLWRWICQTPPLSKGLPLQKK